MGGVGFFAKNKKIIKQKIDGLNREQTSMEKVLKERIKTGKQVSVLSRVYRCGHVGKEV